MSSERPVLFDNQLWLRIRKQAEMRGSVVCIRDTRGVSVTFSEFVRMVDAIAVRFVSQGVQKGDRVLFLSRATIVGIAHLFAILRVGGIPVLADPAMGRSAYKSRIALAKVSCIVLEPALYVLQQVPLLEKIFRMLGVAVPDTGNTAEVKKICVLSPSIKNPPDFAEQSLDVHADALIVFTSGTTDLPKGVVHTYRSLCATLDLVVQGLNPKTDDVFYASQSYFLLIALLAGATAILPRRTRFLPSRYLKDLRVYGVTKSFLIPAEGEELVTHCSARGERLPSTLRSIMFGSAPVLKGFLLRFKKILDANTDIVCIYGATEILPVARISADEKLAYGGKGDILGKPFESISVRVEAGEIRASGGNLADRYLSGEKLNEYVTGDLGELDSEGRLVLLGRKKDMIIKGNYNIYPALFEPAISSIRGVRRCALIGVYGNDASDERIVLVVEKSGTEDDASFVPRLTAELRSGPCSIDTYAFPDRIFCMELPLSGRSRKIDKQRLRELIKTRI